MAELWRQQMRSSRWLIWLRLLMPAALPGAIVICVLHCALPSHAHHPVPTHGNASPFLCGQLLAEASPSLPPPLSLTVFSGLIQALTVTVAATSVLWLAPYGMVACALRALLNRHAETPPAPPPRPAT
jgi:hypothetical protein